MSSQLTIDRVSRRRVPRKSLSAPSSVIPTGEINGSLAFAGSLAKGLFLACGWIISATAREPTITLQAESEGALAVSPLVVQWQEDPSLSDFLESGVRALGKLSFIAIFADVNFDGLQPRVSLSESHSQQGLLTLSLPDETFADYFASASASQQFEIVLMLGGAVPRLHIDQRRACQAAIQPWLDEMVVCESGISVGSVALGFDQVVIGDDGQVFVEGWMKATGQSRPPNLRLAVAHCSSFVCKTIDEAVLRPDIAPPGAGGLKRPGFFIVGQSRIETDDGVPPIVLELNHGALRHYFRLRPRQLHAEEWRTTLLNRIADETKVLPEARRELLTFFATPALIRGPWAAPARHSRQIAALCVIDVAHHDPFRSLIQASLARMPANDIKILIVADEQTNKARPDIGPIWATNASLTVFGQSLAEVIRAAKLKPDDAVLFISSATLMRRGLFEALEDTMSVNSATLLLCISQDMPPAHVAALEALLVDDASSTTTNARQRKSIAYLDFFAPLVAPAGEILELAESWSPPLAILTYREAVRRAATQGFARIVMIGALSTYRQQNSTTTGVAALYKDLL